jgi:hypothetical protein
MWLIKQMFAYLDGKGKGRRMQRPLPTYVLVRN